MSSSSEDMMSKQCFCESHRGSLPAPPFFTFDYTDIADIDNDPVQAVISSFDLNTLNAPATDWLDALSTRPPGSPRSSSPPPSTRLAQQNATTPPPMPSSSTSLEADDTDPVQSVLESFDLASLDSPNTDWLNRHISSLGNRYSSQHSPGRATPSRLNRNVSRARGAISSSLSRLNLRDRISKLRPRGSLHRHANQQGQSRILRRDDRRSNERAERERIFAQEVWGWDETEG